MKINSYEVVWANNIIMWLPLIQIFMYVEYLPFDINQIKEGVAMCGGVGPGLDVGTEDNRKLQ